MIATIANSAWLATSFPAWCRYVRALDNPKAAQDSVLRRLIARNASCEYGQLHSFGAIRSYENFCEAVPIMDYKDIEPWVRRIMHGKCRVLTTEPVARLVPTGGSTGACKLIPYTESFHRELSAAIAPWIWDLSRLCPSISNGPAYWSISPSFQQAAQKSVVPIGFDDDSAYLGGFARRLAAATFAVPSSVRLIADANDSRYVTLLCLLRARELRLVSVWHPSFLSLMLDTLSADWDELLSDIENGGYSREKKLPPEVAAAISYPANPQRAQELRECGSLEIARIWPKWKIVSCWGDAQAELPLNALRERLSGMFIQPKGLLATEAFVTIPFRGRHPLALTSHFFEFETTSGTILRAHELQLGETYAVIITTGGGLWRYRLGDFVKVDGFLRNTPSLRFVGRGSGTSDVCGEKLTEPFVTSAIAVVCKQCSFSPSFAMLAPECDALGRHGYTLFHDGIAPTEFASRLDEALSANPHYAHCLRLGQLRCVELFPVPQNAYEKYTAAESMDTRPIGSIKPKSLSARKDWRSVFES